MASFLSKVFPRKKEKDANKRASVSSLLEGKFEAVSPTVSPSAAKFEEDAQKTKERGRSKEKEKEKDAGFSLFRTKSRPLSPAPDTPKTVLETPRLTLNLPVPKEERSRALGVVFEGDPDDRAALPDNVIGERRLNPLEALLLVKACSSAIIANGGLETLGVMHPFWYSASPEVQRKLISLFILSLAPKSPITTLSPSPTSALSTFDTELVYTRSPHDIAAVLRWALRHLRLEGESFGRVDEQWKWYQTFSEAERTSSFATNAFSNALAPQLAPSHLQLLIATLDIVSSLAAHSEHNGISGSKLTKFFGLWLLTAQRSEQNDDWASFYARWERAGRILEHLFLAHIRDEMARKKIPLRLAELVKGYPYHNRSPSADSAVSVDTDLLPRPRFSTRQYDALYVRVDTEVVDGKPTKQKQHPLRLISDALKSDLGLTDVKFASIWEAVKNAALANDEPEPILTHVEGYPSVSRIFADETIRLLSVIPASSSGSTTSDVPTIRVPRPPRKRSGSIKSSSVAKGTANGNGKAPTNGAAATRTTATPTSPNPPSSPKDWVDFSSAGFEESTLGKDFVATLLDKDIEVTAPRPVVERKTSRKRKASPGRSRGNSVATSEPEPPVRVQPLSPAPAPKSKSTVVSLLKLDEAFIDFWSDALLDPISSDWPNFVVAQLKALPGLEIEGKPINWLVLEQRYVTPPPPPAPVPAESPADIAPPLKRASSPRPSMRSEMSARKSSTLAAARKRLTFFSSSQTLGGLASKAESKAPARKKAKPTRVGEMGEILSEDDGAEKKPEIKEDAKTAGPAPKETAPAPPADAPKAVEAVVVASPEQSTATTTPAVSEPAVASGPVPPIVPAPASPTIDALSPLTPTADDFPAVPVVGGLLASAAAATTLAVVEPLKTEDAQTEDTPVLAVAEQPIVPADSTPTSADVAADVPQEKTLPPAPEPVVLTGETPGPQVALSTSEPAALAELSTKIDEVVAQAASEPDIEKLPSTLNPEVTPVEPEVEQPAEVIPEAVVEEEVVPSITPAEAPAVVQEAAIEEAEEETPVFQASTEVPVVAPEADAPAVAAEVEAPAVEAKVEDSVPVVAAVSEASEPTASIEAPAAPEAVHIEAPVLVAQVLPEPSTEEAPAVEETPVEKTPVVEEAPVTDEAPVVDKPAVVEGVVQAEPVPVQEEPVVEAVDAPAAPEQAEEEIVAPIEESTPIAAEEIVAETEAPATEPEAPVESELPEETETLIAAEPEAPEPETSVVAETEPEVTAAPEPEPEVLKEEAPVPVAAVEPEQEEAQPEEIPAVIEDVAAPTVEEAAAEPVVEEATVVEAEKPAVPESTEAPAAEPEPTSEESPVADAPVHEEPAAEPEVAPVHEEPVAAPEPATIDEPKATPEVEAPIIEAEEAPAAEAEEAPAVVEPEVEQTPVVAEEVTVEEPVLAAEEAPAAPVEVPEAPAQPTSKEPAEAAAEPEASEEPKVTEKPENGSAHAEVKTAEDVPAVVEDAVAEEKPAAAVAEGTPYPVLASTNFLAHRPCPTATSD
ncbi:Zonadhesin [Trametes pubescens]|uniref:Zonadhesin n=1 Tax=Trametes pubescens TaxID=154538 RepID=A0A1M2VB75_TRAPU|nr:Zonadhesin [Trametes pubescens]